MKTKGSLVDTSVWIDFFRGVTSVRAFLNDLILKDRVFICGPIFFELLQGIKSAEEKIFSKTPSFLSLIWKSPSKFGKGQLLSPETSEQKGLPCR